MRSVAVSLAVEEHIIEKSKAINFFKQK